VDLEEKYAIALGVLSIVLWGGGTVLAKWLSKAPARVTRTVFPIAAVLTLAAFFVFVSIARHDVHG
jgi:drug/metabolite transporter (DMT)-like permease